MIEKIYKWLTYFQLGNEQEDYQTVHEVIEKGVYFKGTNLWILICAILIASVGLNMNSTAVIIGAMLISPLMGPINGIGYSIATYDFTLFKRSVMNFTFAVTVSLLTSAVYFFISPVNTAHSELLARTSPTIYDVFIALFGGVAGMLAISSKLKGNVIPGVAIATALMPPICTAGYGLATLQFGFFFGALYLFTINTVFIGVAAMVVAQVLKFPITTVVNEKKAQQVKHYITAILVITIIPSIIFGYQLVKKERFLDNSKNFINDISIEENNYLLDNKVNASSGKIQLIYSGYKMKKETVKSIKETALRYKLDTAKIAINTGSDADILNQQTEKMYSEKELLNSKLNATANLLKQTKSKLDSIKRLPMKGNALLNEINQLYPQIKTFSYSETYQFPDTSKIVAVIVIETKRNSLIEKDKVKIQNWLKTRLEENDVKVYFEE